MAVEYMDVFKTIGSVASKHPQSSALLMQTYSLWKSHLEEFQKIQNEFQKAAVSATGTFDQVAIVMQLLALHPSISQLLVQTLSMWQGRIPDLIQIINEVQANSSEANK